MPIQNKDVVDIFNILAYPTGRLINVRNPYAVDLEKSWQQQSSGDAFWRLMPIPSGWICPTDTAKWPRR